MTDEQIRESWTGFIDMCEKIADPGIWSDFVLQRNVTDTRLKLVEQFVDIMRGFGHDLTDEQVHVATGNWARG